MLQLFFDSGLSLPLILINLCIFIVTLAVSLSMHEIMHGWAAYKCGDPTAKEQGRLSFNPLVHLDPVGTIMMLLAGFGWAKPVMINPGKMNRFKNRNISLRIVSLAGVTANFAMAFIAYFLLIMLVVICYYQNIYFELGYFFTMSADYSLVSILLSILATFLYVLFERNLVLMAFNLIPIPPLDGFHFVETFLPAGIRYKLSSMGRNLSYILFLVMMFGRYTNTNILGRMINFIMIPFEYAIVEPLGKLLDLLIPG